MKRRNLALALAAFATLTTATIPTAMAQSAPSRNNVFCGRSSPAMATTPEARAQYEASEQRYRECIERARQNGQDVPEPKPACKPGECRAAPR